MPTFVTTVSLALLLQSSFGILIDNRPSGATVGAIQGDNPAYPAGISAARELLSELKPGDEVLLMSFTGAVEVHQDFTSDAEKIRKQRDQIKPKPPFRTRGTRGPPTEATTLSAVNQALDRMKKARHPNKILIVVSKQLLEASLQEVDKLKAKTDQDKTVIYGLGFDLRGFGRAIEVLTAFASRSGGQVRMLGVMTPAEQQAHGSEFIRTILSRLGTTGGTR
jgi:hypothetical protein